MPFSAPSPRRAFLKHLGLAGAGLVGSAALPSRAPAAAAIPGTAPSLPPGFNMCGYGAEPLEKVRVAILGLGMRGSSAVRRFRHLEAVEIKALVDVRPEKVARAKELLADTSHTPEAYHASESDWQRACDRDDIDLVYICTPWALHAPMAVYAMEHGKHAAIEVPAAQSLEECWQLVETSERTRRHCMMLENCCYDSVS